MQEGGDAYKQLKENLISEINNSLKSMMIMQSQKIGLEVVDDKMQTSRLSQSYSDIGLAWKLDASTETAAKIDNIINNTFTQKSGYEFYLEKKLMKKFKLKYAEDSHVKGSIARMIVTRKCELSKVINKRVEQTRQKIILKVRYNKEKENAKKIGAKKVNSFQINDSWYNADGSVYDANKDSFDEKELDNFYVEKIKI